MTCFGGAQPDLAAVEGVIPVREDPAVTLYNDVPEDKKEAASARLLPKPRSPSPSRSTGRPGRPFLQLCRL